MSRIEGEVHEDREEDHDLGKPFRVRAQVRNNRMIRARERLGYASAKVAATALQVPYEALVQFEALKISPTGARGEWRGCARRIAVAYGVEPEDLWPECIAAIAQSSIEIEVGAREVLALSAAVDPQVVADARLYLLALMGRTKLHGRQERLLILRYGLDGSGERSFEEIGKELGVSRERVRQIEQRALRNLRHAAVVEKTPVAITVQRRERDIAYAKARDKLIPIAMKESGGWRNFMETMDRLARERGLIADPDAQISGSGKLK